MNLAVQVGDQTVTFRADGGKQIRVDARDQEYNINGSSTLTARTRDNGGGVSGITLTYTYIGEGSVRLSEKDAGKTVVLTLKAVNSRVVAMDLSSGAGETEITLNLQR